MNTNSVSLPGLLRKSLGWCIALSIFMIVAGLFAIVVPLAAGIAVTVLIGWLLVFSGLTHILYAWNSRGSGSILWEVLVGLAYLLVGGYVLYHPPSGMASLTLALAIYLVARSVLEFILAVQLRPRSGTSWLFLDGLITLVLALMIWRTWPSSAAWVLGTLVGINMLFTGVTRLMISMAARKALA